MTKHPQRVDADHCIANPFFGFGSAQLEAHGETTTGIARDFTENLEIVETLLAPALVIDHHQAHSQAVDPNR